MSDWMFSQSDIFRKRVFLGKSKWRFDVRITEGRKDEERMIQYKHRQEDQVVGEK